MVAKKAATKKKRVPKANGRPSKYPGDKKSIPLMIKVGSEGGGKHAMAVSMKICHKTILEWLNPDHATYKGDGFSKAVEEGLTLGAAALLERVANYSVDEPGEGKINMGAVKFLAQHKYNMVEKTVQETQGGLHVHVDKEDADL